jgi:hypothetical protein
MRTAILPLVLLAVTACSRSHAPTPATSALASSPDSEIAASVPAGGAPAPTGTLVGTPAEGASTAAAIAASEAPPDKSDAHWADVDPNTLGGRDEKAMAAFQAEQRKRDAEMMQRDAAEANARTGSGRDEDRYADSGDARDERDERYPQARDEDPRDPRDDPRYDPREDPRYDPRDDEGPYYGDMPQDPAYDDGPYAEPPGDDEDEYPPPDDDEDPRYEPPYRP